MLQNEMGFTFAGRHTSEFGLVWVESKSHTLAPEVIRNEYTIAGKSGTVLLPGKTRKPLEFSGSLFLVDDEPESQREAQMKAREILAWLCQGRQRLIFDYEPDRFYLAQVDKAITWSLATWFGGEISITLTAQPDAYSAVADVATVQTNADLTNVALDVHTLYPAPLEVRITNTGAAIISSVTVMGGVISLAGLALAHDQSLTISMEEPIGAYLNDGRNALPLAHRFDQVNLEGGQQSIPIVLGFDETGDREATISVAVRGRW